MVQHVGTVEPELNLLGLGEPELLAQAGIESPAAWSDDCLLPESPALARRRVLQNDPIAGIRDGPQRASVCDSGPDIESHRVGGIEKAARSANRIGHDLIGSDWSEICTSKVRASDVLSPLDRAAIVIPGADHIRSAVAV